MIGKKSAKCSYKKKIQIVPTKAQFDNIPITHKSILSQHEQAMDQYIIVPSYYQVSPVHPPKNKIIPASYIKTLSIRQLMSKEKYELDQLDLYFLNKNLKFLGEKQFRDILIVLQKQAHKYGVDFDYEEKLQNVIERAQIVIEYEQKSVLYKQIYNYWRNKRQNIKSPLLREYWVKNNQIGPFKSRELAKRLCLRNRTDKIQMDQIKEILKLDLLALKKILSLMQRRQEQQKNLLLVQTAYFQKFCQKVFNKISNDNKNKQIVIEKQNNKETKSEQLQQAVGDRFRRIMNKQINLSSSNQEKMQQQNGVATQQLQR